MIRKSFTTTLATAVVLGSMLAAGASGVTGAATPQAVRGTKPAWANASHLVRRADPSQVIGSACISAGRTRRAPRLSLVPFRSSEFLVRQVPDASPVPKRFAPSDNDIAAVQKWLRSAGFKLTHTPANHHFVAVSGTARQTRPRSRRS
jgi:hypothetical protein